MKRTKETMNPCVVFVLITLSTGYPPQTYLQAAIQEHKEAGNEYIRIQRGEDAGNEWILSKSFLLSPNTTLYHGHELNIRKQSESVLLRP